MCLKIKGILERSACPRIGTVPKRLFVTGYWVGDTMKVLQGAREMLRCVSEKLLPLSNLNNIAVVKRFFLYLIVLCSRVRDDASKLMKFSCKEEATHGTARACKPTI